jgi:RND family efflux transporter MFP subunit
MAMTDRRVMAAGAALVLSLLGAAVAQGPGRTGAQPPAASSPTTARVETAPLDLVEPDRFRVPAVFQPVRRVTVVATDDGLVQGIATRVGEKVRERQDLVQLDRTEAAARLKIAKAELKERQAAVKATPDSGQQQIAAAQVEAAEARVELAQLALDRCTLKAPFAGLVLALPVSVGQFVTKGTTVAELADVSDLRVLVPVDRTRVKEGQTLQLTSEGRTVTGKVASMLPLPESYSALRELATPWSAALVVVDNPATAGIEPGQRVVNPFLPVTPIATVPGRAIRSQPSQIRDAPATAYVQVVRNEHVANVPVSVLGEVGPERMQVAGAFRPADAVIVESSMPLAAGTFIRFGGDLGTQLQAMPPNPDASGALAEITPAAGAPAPAGTTGAAPAPATRVAPIGAPDSAAPRPAATTTTRPAPRPAQPQPAAKGGAVPF